MAAFFYDFGNGRDMFRNGLTINLAIRIPFLSDMLEEQAHAIITDVSIVNNDTVQYFLTFDDVISYFYFGKGLGTISIGGLILTDCENYQPGIDVFYNSISEVRGKPVTVSFGAYTFTGVISSFEANAESEFQSTNFRVTLAIIDHSLPPAQFESIC